MLLFVLFLGVVGYNNGVGKDTMDGLIKNGLDKVGFKYVNLDDCWQLVDRDERGQVVVDPKAFPNGIKYLVDEAHKRGLKLGIYTDIGTLTCQGRAGSYGFYDIDAVTYADWGIDYLKCDFCYTPPDVTDHPWNYYRNFSDHLNRTGLLHGFVVIFLGHHMLFSLCEWGQKDPETWAASMKGNSWRSTFDIQPNFESVLTITEHNEKLARYAGNYNFNDPDMLEVGVVSGNHQLTDIENKAHFSLWCFMAAPLLLGVDLRGEVRKEVLDVITNEDIISINQDELGRQGFVVAENRINIHDGECAMEVWFKPLKDGKIAVMLFNHASTKESVSPKFKAESIEVKWEEIMLDPGQNMDVFDAWNNEDLGQFSEKFKAHGIEQHDVVVLIMTPK